MSITTTKQPIQGAFELKGGLYPLTIIKVLSNDLSLLEEQLFQTVQQAPNFFNHTPVVIDFQAIPTSCLEVDLPKLKSLMKRHRLNPIGIKPIKPELAQKAIQAGFAIFHDHQEKSNSKSQDEATQANQSKQPKQAVLIEKATQQKRGTQTQSSTCINHPVRSGQQIFTPTGDLIVLGPVSQGAELLAVGNIHVYGTLKGRALAGIHGEEQAKIFCTKLEAELISIAGHFKLIEDLDPKLLQKPVMISLDNHRLQIQAL